MDVSPKKAVSGAGRRSEMIADSELERKQFFASFRRDWKCY